MTQKTANGEVTNYIYNIEDRLVEVRDGSGSLISSYYYDPFGRRLWKEVSGVRRYFHYADGGLIGEYSSTGTEIKTYGYKPGSTWTTDPLFMKVGSEYYFYHTDYLGTPQKLTATNGAVVWSGKYSSFGKANVDGSSTITNNLRFPGQYFDAETGLHYNWHRYYDPSIGRYLNDDPIGFCAGTNLFAYVFSNPVNSVDYYGLFAVIKYCRNLNTITATDSDDNSVTVIGFDSGPGPAGNEYTYPYQIPPDTYKVTRRTLGGYKDPRTGKWKNNDGRPTLSNTDRWDRVKSPTDRHGFRDHIQLHRGQGPQHSKGCIVSPEMNKIRKVIDDEYDRGGVTMIIADDCCPGVH